MNRRAFLDAAGVLAAGAVGGLWSPRSAGAQGDALERPRVCLTVDDPIVAGTRPWPEVNRQFLEVLDRHQLRAGLFVCGMRVEGPEGRRLVGEWDDAGHLIGSHSYSHLMYLRRTSYEAFAEDFLRNEPVVEPWQNRVRLFRYPFLKEGETPEKRDGFRALLREHGYGVAHVTIDTSEWYVDERWTARRMADPAADPQPYRAYLLAHLLERAGYYRNLMRVAIGRDVPHVLLVHHRELTAMSLDAILTTFEDAGWTWVDADAAFGDPVYRRAPLTLPGGESLAWALAAETGRFDGGLRWPGEDSTYQAPEMDTLGL